MGIVGEFSIFPSLTDVSMPRATRLSILIIDPIPMQPMPTLHLVLEHERLVSSQLFFSPAELGDDLNTPVALSHTVS